MRTLFVLLAVALAAAGGYFAVERAGRPEVRLVRPTVGPAVHAVYATGVVEPEIWAAVAPLDGGRIVAIDVFENTDVAAGEPLARLDDAEARAVIDELEARRDFLEKEAERTRNLLERGVISEKSNQQAVSELREVLAAIAGAKVRRDHLILRAPISGTVLRRDGEIGEVVERGEVVFWVGAPRPLRIEAEVDEEDIPLVRPGQTVKIKADAFPGRALAGVVDEITPKGDPVNKSFRVRIALPDETPLMTGMTAETNIVVAERSGALLVPTNALLNGAVWTVADGRAVRTAVETGITGQAWTEITAGLDPDQAVIAEVPPDLADGDAVTVLDGGGDEKD
jgi:RND family efflux transporter MFP subunit